MKWKLSLPEPQMLVYYSMKLTGLIPLTVKKERFYPPTSLGKLYSASVVAICISFTTAAFIVVSKTLDAIKVLPVMLKLESITLYLATVTNLFVTMITLSLRCNKVVWMMNKFCIMGNELEKLGIREDHGKFFKNLFAAIVLTNVIIAAISLTIYFLNPYSHNLASIAYGLETWMNTSALFIFASMLLFVRQRFTLVNQKLYDLFKSAGRRQTLPDLQIFVVSRNLRPDNQTDVEDLTDAELVRNIEAVHMDLCDLVDQTNSLFAIPHLFKSLQFFADLIMCCVWMYSVVQSSSQLCCDAETVSFVIAILPILARMGIVMCELFVMAYASVTTCREGNATKSVVSELWNDMTPQELQDEFSVFSLQLMHKRVTVSIFGFLDLDYSYPFQIFCAAVAYFIVVIQFHSNMPKLGV